MTEGIKTSIVNRPLIDSAAFPVPECPLRRDPFASAIARAAECNRPSYRRGWEDDVAGYLPLAGFHSNRTVCD